MRQPHRFRPACLLGCLVLLLWTSPGYALWDGPLSKPVGWVSNNWSRFDRFLATFDPAGRYVRQPIERRVPALTFKGFYRQWSDVLLTSSQTIHNRRRDFRFLQLQNLLELESHYQLSPNIEITNISHFLYDGVYNWQDSSGLYGDRVSETLRGYHNLDRIVRELYVSYRTHNLDLVIGKQQIAWGKMDGRYIDTINAIDNREGAQVEANEYEFRRLPVFMLNTTYFFGANSLNFLWIPHFEHDRSAPYGSPWALPFLPPNAESLLTSDEDLLMGRKDFFGNYILKRRRPSSGNWGDHEFGARLDVSMEPLTWGLVYYYAWNKSAQNFIVDRAIDQDGDIHLILQPRHTRLHHFGITADYATSFANVPIVGELPMVLRVEGLWTKAVEFQDTSRFGATSGLPAPDFHINTKEHNAKDVRRMVAARRRAGLGERFKSGGHVSRDTMRAAVALEFALPGNTSFIFQPSLLYTFDWRESLGSGFGGAIGDEWNVLPVVFVGRPFRFTRDRLNLSVTAIPWLSGPNRKWQGIKTRLTASYNFSQFITGRMTYTAFSGGYGTDLYAIYGKYDNVGWELSYEF